MKSVRVSTILLVVSLAKIRQMVRNVSRYCWKCNISLLNSLIFERIAEKLAILT